MGMGLQKTTSNWSVEELNYLDRSEDISVDEICATLNRSPSEISRARGRLTSRRASELWSKEEDDFVASTPNLTARQVAKHMGRSYGSITARRELLTRTRGVTFGAAGGNKNPYRIGGRPLIAKTCSRCGLLRASEWFRFRASKSQQREWSSACRFCEAGEQRMRNRENPRPQSAEKSKSYSKKSRAKVQALTISRATNHGQPWLEADHAILRNPDLTLLEKALTLGRTYIAVSSLCRDSGYRSHVGLGSAERDQWIIDNPNLTIDGTLRIEALA